MPDSSRIPHQADHPIRPPQPRGQVYSRADATVGQTFSLRVIDPVADLDLFHGWMNQPRVDMHWDLAGSREDHADYLRRQAEDPHIYGLISAFDGEDAGYFEAYWAKEDRLGPYYDAEDYDRGWHGLIGNPKMLGRRRTLCAFRSVNHYLFLDEARTRRIVGEPNAAHPHMIRYGEMIGYRKVKEFDFPHKRAALMICEREAFIRHAGF